jgi:hypothetical protein
LINILSVYLIVTAEDKPMLSVNNNDYVYTKRYKMH